MTTIDPATGQPLPADAIQRVLYLTPKVHVYAVPPLTSNKGYTASIWTVQPPIFTARLRVLETAIPLPTTSTTAATTAASRATNPSLNPNEKVTTTILLEDPATGDLFAAAPYTSPTAVSPCIDSSRFFALRVVGEGGRKATLGIGYEERSDAFDFGVALQEAAKVLGVEAGLGGAPAGGVRGARAAQVQAQKEVKRDYSLKEGQTITVNIGGKGSRAHVQNSSGGNDPTSPALFKMPPPPADGSTQLLPPPPSAADVRRSRSKERELTAEEQGFDDGEFGEFQ